MPAARCTVLVLVALFVTLIPTTIGALLSAIGIAGMDRLVRFNVLAMSGRAVEAAGDVDTLLLDKTGTITLGNRQATEFLPLPGVNERDLADAAQLASLSRRDAGRPLDRRAGEGEIRHPRPRHGAAECASSFRSRRRRGSAASTVEGSSIRKGAVDAVLALCRRDAQRDMRAGEIDVICRTHRQDRAARRWPSPRTASCSASST